MKISKSFKIVFGLIILVGIYRGARVFLTQVKMGETRSSPDGLFRASAMENFGETFWGEKRHWLEFSLESATFQKTLKTDFIEGPSFGSRSSHSVVRWEEDSKAVHFVFPEVTLTLKTPPNKN